MIEAILFLILTLVLIFLEFYLPGGVLAVLSVVSYLVSILCLAQSGYSLLSILSFIVFSISMAVITVRFAIGRIRKSASKNTFYLDASQVGYTGSSVDMTLIGKSGIAQTDLGPSGFAEIDQKRVQVLSSGPYIERGEKIVVISAQGSYLVVQRTN